MPIVDGAAIITVVEIEQQVATVLIPDGTLEEWSLASLPAGVLEGSQVRLTLIDGDLEIDLLPRSVPSA